jgi:hypothetical protein
MLHRSIVFCVAVGLIVALAGKAYSGSISGSTIEVSGLPNPIQGSSSITVTLQELNATNTSDVDVVVVGPTGALVLLGGAGATFPVGPLTIMFDDLAPDRIPPDLSASGSFKPTQSVPIGSFPSPGPGLAYDSPATVGTTTLSNLASGTNLNGTWSLYAMDTVSGDSTDIASGWSMHITIPSEDVKTFTNNTPIVIPTAPEPSTLALAAFGFIALAAWRLRHR